MNPLSQLPSVDRLLTDPAVTALHQLSRPETRMRAAAERLLPALQRALASLPVSVEIVPLQSQIGSGSLPVDRLPSAGIAIRPHGKKSGVLRIEAALRGSPRPVIGRTDNGALLLDLRCLAQTEFAANRTGRSCS